MQRGVLHIVEEDFTEDGDFIPQWDWELFRKWLDFWGSTTKEDKLDN